MASLGILMPFTDEPARDVEYRDLYGFAGLGDALADVPNAGGVWKTAVARFAPIYLKARGYGPVRWDAKPDDPDFVAAALRYRQGAGAVWAPNGPVTTARAMTEVEFEQHVGSVLVLTLAAASATAYVGWRKLHRRHLRTTAAQVARADDSAWPYHERRRSPRSGGRRRRHR